MPRTKLDLPIVEVEFSCFNCDGIMKTAGGNILFCSERCQQEAAFVRSFRKSKSNGKLNQSDIQEGLQFKITYILGGGYNSRLRQLPSSVRQKVYERDNETCRKCGKAGRDIDHIKGNSSDLENLQVLCRECHNKKTKSNFRELTPEVENYEEKINKINALRLRAESKMPQRIADDEGKWEFLWRGFRSERQSIINRDRLFQHARNQGFDVPE